MTAEKILEVIEIHRAKFKSLGIEKQEHPRNMLILSSTSGLEHCYAMLDKMVELVKAGRIEKAFRWLGFIQGCLWMAKIYTIEELKNQSRPD